MATAREVRKQIQEKKLTNTKELKKLKSTLHLRNVQKDFLFGTILGDGCLITSRSGKSACLQVRHNKKYKEYVYWKYLFFVDWVTTPPRNDNYNNSFYFRTLSHPDLMNIKRMFYVGTKRVIPSNINCLLKSPLSLTIWLMDDGNGYKEHSGFKISSYGFGLKVNLLLQNCLRTNFSLHPNIYKDTKGYTLRFLVADARHLYSLSKPFVVPCMRYKFRNLQP